MKPDLTELIRDAAEHGNYALRAHTVSHMLAEGFAESHIVETIRCGRIIEHYVEEDRCLIAGTFHLTPATRESLHVVIDYWSESGTINWLDIVTAYIPRRPFWENPYRRGKRKS